MSEQKKGVPLLSGAQTVTSIRDSGYKSTDYAIAELIDNAFDANAKDVTVVIVEESVPGPQRVTQRVTEILVIDDGQGMTEERANLALSFGGSGDYNNRENIGRFGMGLPQSSVSQCRKTEVWSWQQSQPEGAHRTCLDLDVIEQGTGLELTVPWPTLPTDERHVSLPGWVIKLFRELHEGSMTAGQPTSSGTIVRWTNLDRMRWVKASSVITHTSFLLGRIYRRFLHNQKRRINIAVVNRGKNGEIGKPEVHSVKPNDPLFLLNPKDSQLEYWEKKDTKASNPDDSATWIRIVDEPPFTVSQTERNYQVPCADGHGTSNVTVRFSEAKPEARPGRNAGAHTHLGKHAKHNRGISMVRADRELLLEQTLVAEPVDRWWGVEVEFPPDLDETFGVTNNKQDTPYFTSTLRYALENDDVDPKSAQEQALFEEGSHVSHLYKIAYEISSAIRATKKSSKSSRKNYGKNTNPTPPRVAVVATDANKKFSKEHPTKGERDLKESGLSKEDAAGEIQRQLPGRHGVDPEAAEVVANQYREGVSVHFLETRQSQSPAFFWPDEIFDDTQVYLNSDHPAYERLIEPLRLSSEDINELSEENAKSYLGLASDSLALLLQAFSRLELEVQNDSTAANHYREVREEWGRRLREIVGSEEFLDQALFGEDEEG